MTMKISLIGLGNMGSNMAVTLQKAGFQVSGTDRDPIARERVQAQGVATFTPEQLPEADVYLLSLPTSDQVEEVVMRKPGLIQHARAGSVIMDTSTSQPDRSRQLAEQVQAAGLQWLDAPVSGGPRGAATGSLGMLLGGHSETIEQLQPVICALAARHTHVGGAGAGHVVKLANNFLCAAHLLTTAHATAMAQQHGVDLNACLQGINSGSGRSAVSEVNFPEWIVSEHYDSGFTMGLMRKDLRLALQACQDAGLDSSWFAWVLDAWQNSPASDNDDFNRVVQGIGS